MNDNNSAAKSWALFASSHIPGPTALDSTWDSWKLECERPVALRDVTLRVSGGPVSGVTTTIEKIARNGVVCGPGAVFVAGDALEVEWSAEVKINRTVSVTVMATFEETPSASPL